MATFFCSNAKLSCEPKVLGAIKDEGVNLAVWERNEPGGVDILIANGARDVQFACTLDQLGVGHVGMFKGKLATDEPAIHRSPPIEGSGQQRLQLVLNPV